MRNWAAPHIYCRDLMHSHKVFELMSVYLRVCMSVRGRPKKRGHGLMTILLSNLSRFKKKFTGRLLGKFAVKWILKIPPHFAYVATLPCETLVLAKQAINDKL